VLSIAPSAGRDDRLAACTTASPNPTGDPTATPNADRQATPSPSPVNTDGTIADGVTVNGMGLDGMTQDDARIALTNGLPDVSSGKLTINIGA
jgi:hypothetical protein